MQCKYLEYLRTYEMLTKIGHNLVQTVPRIEQEEKGLLQPRSGMQISCRRAKKRDRRKRRIGLSEHGIAALFVARHRSDLQSLQPLLIRVVQALCIFRSPHRDSRREVGWGAKSRLVKPVR